MHRIDLKTLTQEQAEKLRKEYPITIWTLGQEVWYKPESDSKKNNSLITFFGEEQ